MVLRRLMVLASLGGLVGCQMILGLDAGRRRDPGTGGMGPDGMEGSSTSSGADGGKGDTQSASSSSGVGGAAPSSASSAGSGGGGAMTGLVLQYQCGDVKPSDGQIEPHFNIQNLTGKSIPLSSLKLRYYFTLELPSPTLGFSCDFASATVGSCASLTGTFGTTMAMKADHYLEVGFTVGAPPLLAGMQTGELQARFYKMDYSPCDQTNDYSFDPTKSMYADWTRVTLYQDGVLVWGIEP